MSLLVYSFESFPQKDSLNEMFPGVFVFGPLKKGLSELTEIIDTEKPDYVLGVAKTKGHSRFEQRALNRFNKTKHVTKDGPNQYELFVPIGHKIPVSNRGTDSFCNWTMYKLAEYLKSNKSHTRLMFCHLNPKDLSLLVKISQL